MNFTAINTWCIESSCRRYRIAKAMVGDKALYVATHQGDSIRREPFTNGADAKKACVEHSERQGVVA